MVPACTPCLLRRVLATAAKITDDPWLHEKVLSRAMAELIDAERGATPAERFSELHELVCRNLGVSDPWAEARGKWLHEMESLVEPLARKIEAAESPLDQALLAAARSNVFDDEILSRGDVRADLRKIGLHEEGASEDSFAFADIDRFQEELSETTSLLFVHDSAPELWFDRVLIDQIAALKPEIQITSVVRTHPVLLDATREDLSTVGLDEHPTVCRVLDPGTPGIGISLESTQREFREAFESSDLVLAKGQAHFETLGGGARSLYSLFRIKCGVMARQQGSRVGQLIFVRS